jgi:hypothetical protein
VDSVVVYIKQSRYLTAAKREELYSAASLFLNELLGKKDRKVYVEISVRGKGLKDYVDGYCLCTEDYPNGKPKEIMVEIRGDKGLDHAIKCLAHELVHVWQMITGRIDNKAYKGDHYYSPWEIEARELEDPLYELYVKNS